MSYRGAITQTIIIKVDQIFLFIRSVSTGELDTLRSSLPIEIKEVVRFI